jgi:hypothetical protein
LFTRLREKRGMADVFSLARNFAAHPGDALRVLIVAGSALVLIAAGEMLPF